MYQTFYASRVSWASESVEKKTISAKSGFTLIIMFGILTIATSYQSRSLSLRLVLIDKD